MALVGPAPGAQAPREVSPQGRPGVRRSAAGEGPAGERPLRTGRAREPVRKGDGKGERRTGRVTQQPWHARRNSSSVSARHDAKRVRPGCWGWRRAEARFPPAPRTASQGRANVRPFRPIAPIQVLSEPESSPSPGWTVVQHVDRDYKSHNATRQWDPSLKGAESVYFILIRGAARSLVVEKDCLGRCVRAV